ncbi:unnamed protein product [Lampetra fluviatilis]
MRSAAPLLTAQEAGGSVLLPPPPEGQQEVAAQLRQLGQLLASAAQLVARMSLAGFQQNVAMAAGVPAISSTSADPANSLPGPALPANDFTDATQHLRAISADVHLLLTAAPVPLAPDVGNDLFKSRRKFLLRRREEGESPLAFRSALLALGRAAYPRMDRVAPDSLALERLLSLASELGVILAITEEVDLSSLKDAQGSQAHLGLCQWPAVMAYAAVHEEPQDFTPIDDSQAFASFARGQRTIGTAGR